MTRPHSEFLDSMIGVKIPVLDHGFIIVRDYMGVDRSIADAARVSYGDGTRTVNDDTNLIRYLVEHQHSSPLEMCEIKLHIKLPLFVARQWIRHRTANVNEESARYSVMCKEFYTPSAQDMAQQSTNNKQGRGEALTPEQAGRAADKIESFSRIARFNYESLLNEEALARELARMNITLNYYTQWVWKCDLRNLLHFLKLRMDPHAQLEIRKYAKEIWRIVEGWVPAAAEAFEEYELHATKFSAMETELLKRLLPSTIPPEIESLVASWKPRQKAAFLAKIGINEKGS
jgi:thymidylate synthase (FAD)